jgi:hypothetical protein
MVRVADLRYRTLSIHGNGFILCSVEEMEHAASEAEELDKVFEAWSDDIPETWRFSTCAYPEQFNAANSAPYFTTQLTSIRTMVMQQCGIGIVPSGS